MRKALGILLSIGIIAGVCIFFFREFQKNLVTIAISQIEFDAVSVLVSLIATISAYLLVTYTWRHTLLSLSPDHHFTFAESIPAVNIPSLTKYLPGKVWSYAIQMYWLSRTGFSKSVVLYTNLLNMFVSILVSAIIGSIYFIFEPGVISSKMAVFLAISLLAFDIAFVFANSWMIGVGIAIVNRIFDRTIVAVSTPRLLLFFLQILYFAIYLLFGIGAYFLCEGIGIKVSPKLLFSIVSAVAIADSIGFLAFVVPGGLGVREGVMYIVLRGVTEDRLALLLPVVTRIVVMTAETLLGLFSLYLLKRLSGLSLKKIRGLIVINS